MVLTMETLTEKNSLTFCMLKKIVLNNLRLSYESRNQAIILKGKWNFNFDRTFLSLEIEQFVKIFITFFFCLRSTVCMR